MIRVTFLFQKKIKVGYNSRNDTYTKKLAYIIYYDNKGVLRKEKSWNSWRNIDLGDDEFKNEPIEGFILNKHVGGYKSHWNVRQSYCRIYDPRGFEFEITIENLLFILDWTDCIKGKGLIGKFVYSWVGTELVLLPECTEEYKESLSASKKLQKKNFKLSDLIPGTVYKVNSLPYSPIKSEISVKNQSVFIGLVKFMKNFGEKYETKALFYDSNGDFAYVLPTSSILFEVEKDYVSLEEQDEILYRFEHSAYSYKFWNTPGLIKKFVPMNFTIIPKNRIKDKYGYEFKRYSYIEDEGKTVKLLKPYYKYQRPEYTYGIFSKRIKILYNNYTLKLSDSKKIEVIKNIELGKDNLTSSYIYADPIMNYPDASKKDIETIEKGLNIPTERLTTLCYETNDGYFDESLTRLLNKCMLSKIDQSIISPKEIFYLPIKIKENGKI